MASTPDLEASIASVLLRSLDPVAAAAAAFRLTDPDVRVHDEALSTSNFIPYAVPTAGQATKLHVSALASGLRGFVLDPDLLRVILRATTLEPKRQASAVDWLAAWRFSGSPHSEAVPAHAPAGTICIIRAEDVIVDLLLQPVQVLRTYVERMLVRWSERPTKSEGLLDETFPLIRTWDPALAVLELHVLSILGMPRRPITGPTISARFGSRTVAGTVTVPHGRAVAPRINVEALVQSGELLPIDVAEYPWHKNVEPTLNEVFTPVRGTPPPSSEGFVVDPFYGQVYQRSIFAACEAVYGHTAIAFRTADETFANLGYLRVPFRAIGRRLVRTRSEFEDALQELRATAERLGATALAFRGQTKEYYVGRSSEMLTHLYGQPDILEPSLLASGERRVIRHPAWMALWASGVQRHALLNGITPKNGDEMSAFGTIYGDLINLALAQHYGLPTPALDVTKDPKVALWFALNRIRTDEPGVLRHEPQPAEENGVFYVLAINSREAYSGEISDLKSARSTRQKGMFIPTSWGFARNRAARTLVGAIYLPGSLRAEFEDIPSAEYLFPTASQDALLASIRQFADIGSGIPLADELATHLYVVR